MITAAIADEKAARRKALGFIERDEPLARHTSLGVGGPADYFASPATAAELIAAINYARELGLPWLVLGNGTNVLFPDEGYHGLVVHLGRNFSGRRIEGERFYVQAGAGLGEAISYLRARGFYDLDGLVGIPGTIGGAVAMNAGIPEVTISENLISVTALTEKGELLILRREECSFGYRSSIFRQRPWVVLAAEFRLGGERRFEPGVLLKRRRERQPMGVRSAGCIFKNPAGPMSAGELIDAVGLKGLRVGGAMISKVHANFIVNLGGATASDILHLIDIARNKVYKEFRVELRPELVVVSNSSLG